MTQTSPANLPPTPGAFWQWAVALYGKPGVAPACLTLQDGNGVDVNLMLLLLHLATLGQAVGAAELRVLDEAAAPWRHEVVEPLRALRRKMKPMGEDATRKLVQAAELDAERVVQRRMIEALPPLQPSTEPVVDLASRHLDIYAAYIGTTLDMDAVTAILTALAD
ncbi:MAG TPA: TIGR02444 family protein [Stellaceae bacterium]|nr:TIGR02444 family protein [Stellaceae bacterium]